MSIMRTQVDVRSCKSVGTDLSMLDIDDLMTEISQLKKEVALLEEKLNERDELNRKDVSGVSLCDITDQTSPELLVSVCKEEEKPSVHLLDCKIRLKTEITETEEQTDAADLIYPDLMKEEITEPIEIEEKPHHFITGEESQSCLKTEKNFSPKQSQRETDKKSLTCPQLGETFTCKSSLNRHIRIHTEERSQCGKSFACKNKIKVHTKSHTAEKPYRCDQCGKTFVNKSNLKVHMRIHTEGKSYMCDQCGKSFAYKKILKVHMRSHTGEKPYRCDQCGKTFANKSNLKVHMRSHTGEKPYRCDQCEKTFTRKWHVTKHMRVHTGEKPHRCDQCGKSFAWADRLRAHLLCHSGVRPFQCESCSKTFISVCYLKRHMKTHTGVTNVLFSPKERKKTHTGVTSHMRFKSGEGLTSSSQLKQHHRFHTGEKLYHARLHRKKEIKIHPQETVQTRRSIRSSTVI